MRVIAPIVKVGIVAACMALLLAVRAGAETATPRVEAKVAAAQAGLWRCQDQLGVERTRASVSPEALPRSAAYRRWVLGRWQDRRTACEQVLRKRQATWRRLEAGMAAYYRSQGYRDGRGPMTGAARAAEQAGRRYGVSPYFMVAVSVTESSMGIAACRNNRFNVWGLSSCTSGWYVPPFRSWEEAFDFYARFLTGRTSVTSGWPNARTPYDFRGYAACSHCWGRKTSEHMRRVFGVPADVRYPR